MLSILLASLIFFESFCWSIGICYLNEFAWSEQKISLRLENIDWLREKKMNWLVTVPIEADLNLLSSVLTELGCHQTNPPIPLGKGELVIPVEGPENLPILLKQKNVNVNEIYPDSEMMLY